MSENESDNESYESVEESVMLKPTLQRQPPLQEQLQTKPKKQLTEKQKEAFAKGRMKRQENLRNAKKEKLELENYKKKDTLKEYNQPDNYAPKGTVAMRSIDPLEQPLLKKYEPRKKPQPEKVSQQKKYIERPPTPPLRQPIQKDNTLKQRKEALALKKLEIEEIKISKWNEQQSKKELKELEREEEKLRKLQEKEMKKQPRERTKFPSHKQKDPEEEEEEERPTPRKQQQQPKQQQQQQKKKNDDIIFLF